MPIETTCWCGKQFNRTDEDDSLFCSFKCFCEFHELSKQEIDELKTMGFRDDVPC